VAGFYEAATMNSRCPTLTFRTASLKVGVYDIGVWLFVKSRWTYM